MTWLTTEYIGQKPSRRGNLRRNCNSNVPKNEAQNYIPTMKMQSPTCTDICRLIENSRREAPMWDIARKLHSQPKS